MVICKLTHQQSNQGRRWLAPSQALMFMLQSMMIEMRNKVGRKLFQWRHC